MSNSAVIKLFVRFIFICSLDKEERVTIYAKEELIRSTYVDRNVAK